MLTIGCNCDNDIDDDDDDKKRSALKTGNRTLNTSYLDNYMLSFIRHPSQYDNYYQGEILIIVS